MAGGEPVSEYPGVTVVIPSIPPRTGSLLARAMRSVTAQTRPVGAVSIAVDHDGDGAARTRNRALAGVVTEWAAFLDDDDELYPHHISDLLATAERTGADMVYPWFDVPEGFDPFPHMEGRQFSREELREYNYIPVTVLVRTQLIRRVGGFRPKGPPENPCDDWGAWDALVEAGAKIVHHKGRTWAWHWHQGNTSGKAWHW